MENKQHTGTTAAPEEDFAALFEEQERRYSLPKSASILMGRLVSEQGDYFLVDIGLKSEGRLLKSDFPQGFSLEEGSRIPVVRIGPPEEGFGPLLSVRQAVRRLQWDQLDRCRQEGRRVDAQIYRNRREGFFVGLFMEPAQLPGETAISERLWKAFPYPAEMPLTEVDVDDPRPLKRWIGRKAQIKILEVRHNGVVVVSRRRVTEEMREILRKETLANAKEGEALTAKVRKIDDTSVHLDINGVEGVMPQSEASWFPNADLRRRFRNGEIIDVRLVKKDLKAARFVVSRRLMEPNPADELQKGFSPGITVEGAISKVLPNGGFFVRLPGIKREGFVPANETLRDANTQAGDKIKAQVLRVDREKIRVILSPRRLEDKQMPDMVARYSKEHQPLSLRDILAPADKDQEAGGEDEPASAT